MLATARLQSPTWVNASCLALVGDWRDCPGPVGRLTYYGDFSSRSPRQADYRQSVRHTWYLQESQY